MTAPTRRAVLSGLTGLAAAPVSRAFAQSAVDSSYPARNITLVVPFAAGGSTDILARIVAGHLQQSMGQPVVIENRTGASGNIGTGAVARAAPDGYTFLFNTMSVHTMNHALFAIMPFDGVKDFSPITMLAYVTNTMVVHPSVPANTVAGVHRLREGQSGQDRLCVVRSRLDQSSVRGAAREDGRHRDGARAVSRRRARGRRYGRRADAAVLHRGHAESRARQGRQAQAARPSPKASARRCFPTCRPSRETVPGYEMTVWYGAFGPAGMPKEIVARLNAEISRILFLPDVKKKHGRHRGRGRQDRRRTNWPRSRATTPKSGAS